MGEKVTFIWCLIDPVCIASEKNGRGRVLVEKNLMSFILDCESGASAFESLCVGFSCSKETLTNVLLSLDIEDVYRKHGDEINVVAERYLYDYVVANIGNHKPLTSVCWFHLTRTNKGNEFKDGILPLGESLDMVWEMILNVIQDDKVRKELSLMWEAGDVGNSLYDMKSKESSCWGPYAMLVKDIAFCPQKLSLHDYLGMPEIIEDICKGYEERHGDSILGICQKNLTPKIVKFRSSFYLDKSCLEAAICYVYTYIRGLEPSRGAVMDFDGKGIGIQPEDIMSLNPAI